MLNPPAHASRARTAVSRVAACAALLLAAGGALSVEVSAHLALPAPVGLDVQPFPGTPDASPQTSVGFPTLSPGEIRSITVTGSRSGLHPGHLSSLVGRVGAVFVPARPFVSGEHVAVHATLSSSAAGTAAGAPSARQIAFSFAVAAPLRAARSAPAASAAAAGPETAYVIRHGPRYSTHHGLRDTSTWTHTFNSEKTLHPPITWFSGKDLDPKASGDIFADVHRTYVQAGPVIFGPQGGLLWFYPLPNQQAAFNTQVQKYNGSQVLTFWQGYSGSGYGNGYDVIMDHHYRTVTTVHAGNGYQADLHEFYITPQGNAFITAFAAVPNVDLSSVGGSRTGTLLDSIIQEINIKTGQVLWEWHAYGHVHLNETYEGKPRSNNHPYDFFHVNSIQPLPNGKLLVAARNTWAVYEIDMKTGKIPEVIGGRHSYFTFGPGASFAWEHDARMQPDGTITVFDDAPKGASQSRALRLSIDFSKHSVSLVHAFTNSPSVLAQSQGSVQALSDGYTFVGWGSAPYLSEFDRSGTQNFSMHYHDPMESYRGFRFGWWGQPNTHPDVSVSSASRGTTVYAAWNGATLVASWRVLAGSSPNKLLAVGTFPRTAFETAMSVRSTGPYFKVQALGSGGGVRGTSYVVQR